MMKLIAALSAATALTVALSPTVGLTATVTYQFQGMTDSGSFPNETYSGLVSFDDSSLTPDYTGENNISALEFTFLGQNFSSLDAAATPTVSFDNGAFLGLNFSVNNALINSNSVSFSLIPGTDDTSDSFFSYDINTQTGAGNANYTPISQSVPEPPVIPSLFVLWLLGVSTRVKLTK